MSSRVNFIGREKELAQIAALANGWGSKRILGILGTGGIGKTRLLQEAHQRLTGAVAKDIPMLIGQIVDFDDPFVQGEGGFRRRVVQAVGEQYFREYLDKVVDWRKMEQAGVSSARLMAEHEAIHRAFLSCFNALSAQRRVVLFLDTLDKLEKGGEVWAYLLRFIRDASNTLILIAGRTTDLFCAALAPADSANVSLLEISPLDQTSSSDYLQQKQDLVYKRFPADLRDKLLVLARGKPILIDLAVEWLARDSPLDWLISNPATELGHLSPEQEQQFESGLVQLVRAGRSPMDTLTLAMSHVYPLNEELAARLLDLSPEETAQLFAEAQEHSFIKLLPGNRLALHDEMRRMIDKYVWLAVDSEHRRHHYSEVAARYFEEKGKELAAEIQDLPPAHQADYDQLLKLDDLFRRKDEAMLLQLEHALIADQKAGFTLYREMVAKARAERRWRLIKKMQQPIRPFVDSFGETERYGFELLRAQLLTDEGRAADAETILTSLLEEHQQSPERAASIHNALAGAEVELGEFRLALQHQEKCLQLRQELGQDRPIPLLLNHIGYIYRRLGDWSRAIEYYRKALTLVLANREQPDLVAAATVLNNLAYASREVGQYDKAVGYCEQALAIWEKEKSLTMWGASKRIRAHIHRDRREYEQARFCLQEALRYFEEPEDHLELVRVYAARGWTLWYEAVARESRTLLEDAQKDFEAAIALAEEYGDTIELPAIMHEVSNVYFRLGEKDKARQTNARAYQLALELHDIRNVVDSLVGKAEFDLADGLHDRLPDYAAELFTNYESQGYIYLLFYGRMRRILGDAAFERGEHRQAMEYYAQGIAQIQEHSGWGIYDIQAERDKLANRLKSLPAAVARDWVAYLRAAWSQAPSGVSQPLVDWCAQQEEVVEIRLWRER